MSVFIKDFNDFKHLCSYQVSGYCGKDADIEVRCSEKICPYNITIEEKRGNWMNLRTYTDEYENKVNDFMCSNCCNVIRGIPENYKNMPKFCCECGAENKEVQ